MFLGNTVGNERAPKVFLKKILTEIVVVLKKFKIFSFQQEHRFCNKSSIIFWVKIGKIFRLRLQNSIQNTTVELPQYKRIHMLRKNLK